MRTDHLVPCSSVFHINDALSLCKGTNSVLDGELPTAATSYCEGDRPAFRFLKVRFGFPTPRNLISMFEFETLENIYFHCKEIHLCLSHSFCCN